MERGNLFEGLPEGAPEELFTPLLRRRHFEVERIVSYGQASPEGFWYDQERHEWVMVIEGRAGLEIEGEPGILELGPGDHLDIPAHKKHRVAWTAADRRTVWLAVHYNGTTPP
jgi:cupin 2 domain-containing protein